MRRPATAVIDPGARRSAGCLLELPVETVERLLLERLHGLAVRRRRGGRRFEVSVPHWWFGRQCAAEIVLRKRGQGTHLRWRSLAPHEVRSRHRASLVLLSACAGLWALSLGLTLGHPGVAMLLAFAPFATLSPGLLYGVTSGGPTRARRRRWSFEQRLLSALEATERAARERALSAGRVSLLDGAGALGHAGPSREVLALPPDRP